MYKRLKGKRTFDGPKKTQQFRFSLFPERKQQLDFIAQHEGRSLASMLDRLILEKYNQIKGETNDHSN